MVEAKRDYLKQAPFEVYRLHGQTSPIEVKPLQLVNPAVGVRKFLRNLEAVVCSSVPAMDFAVKEWDKIPAVVVLIWPKICPWPKIWMLGTVVLDQRKEQYSDWGYGHHGILQPARRKRI